jgi:hypothetical protein
MKTGTPAYRAWEGCSLANRRPARAFDRELQPVSDIGPETPKTTFVIGKNELSQRFDTDWPFKKVS